MLAVRSKTFGIFLSNFCYSSSYWDNHELIGIGGQKVTVQGHSSGPKHTDLDAVFQVLTG